MVECSRRAEEERPEKGKEVRGGKEEGGKVQKSKAPFVDFSASSSACRNKGEKPFTKEEIQGHKAFVEPAFANDSIQPCDVSFYKTCAHVELARLVVDIESMCTQKGTFLGLGQGSEEEAQKEEVQAGVGEDGSGSGQDQTSPGLE